MCTFQGTITVTRKKGTVSALCFLIDLTLGIKVNRTSLFLITGVVPSFIFSASLQFESNVHL